ncbi:MAG: TonB-dependent receptor plug domain-containing protein, partial [Candidatus Dadabacteria bacterium]|nr:TonB-dependent receptor plug domain-containing protein [Candidatus Dadabacteria bacterium]
MRKYMGALIAILTALSPALPAHAEDKPSASPAVNLERIVVTPSRMERGLSDIASSVNIVTEEAIKSYDAKTVPDALKNIEGIYAYDPTGVGAGGTVNMRGFYGGMSTYQLVLIDGVPQNKGKDKMVNWDMIPIANVERIEVMKGPASSLYGDNAMSGVINIITKKPSGVPHAGASMTYGNYVTQNYAGYLSGTSDRLGYYLGVSGRLTNGFREHGDYENIQAYGKADYAINDAQNLKANFD